jgi:hypothetical protein
MTRIDKLLAVAAFAAAAITGIACSGSTEGNTDGSSFTASEATPTGPVLLAGTLLVGKDIAPGTYQGTASGYCYVARLGKEENDIIANDLYERGDKVTLTVKATDHAVKIDKSCGLAKP